MVQGIGLQGFFERVTGALAKHKVRYSIVGGLAVSLHGAVRGTTDVDAVIEHTKDQFERCEAALKSIGLIPRLPVTAAEVFSFRREYIEHRNLIAWSFINPSNPLEIVNVIITHDLKGMRSEKIKIGGRKLEVLSIRDLIAMKRDSGRAQDLEDVKALESLLEEGER